MCCSFCVGCDLWFGVSVCCCCVVKCLPIVVSVILCSSSCWWWWCALLGVCWALPCVLLLVLCVVVWCGCLYFVLTIVDLSCVFVVV